MTITTLLLICTFSVPAVGGLWISCIRDYAESRKLHSAFSLLTLILSLFDFLAYEIFTIDSESALISLNASGSLMLLTSSFIYYIVPLSTQKTKFRRVPGGMTLLSQSLTCMLFSFQNDWWIIIVFIFISLIPVFEFKSRSQSSRIYVLHSTLIVLFISFGYCAKFFTQKEGMAYNISVIVLAMGILIRCGCVPFHIWIPNIAESLSFGTGIMQISPMIGTYLLIKLLLPVVTGPILHIIGYILMGNLVYSAGMALVQIEARRYYAYICMSLSELTLLGFVTGSSLGSAAGLSLWFSFALSTTGIGVTIRSLESRMGRLNMDRHHGLYEQMPLLAAFFLITGLSCIGFPGTSGFAGIEILLESVTSTYPGTGIMIILGTTLNGIAIMHGYFKLFTGKRHIAVISLNCRQNEKIAVISLTFLILGLGILPNPILHSRIHAVKDIIRSEHYLKHYIHENPTHK